MKTISETLANLPENVTELRPVAESKDEYTKCDVHGDYLAYRYHEDRYLCVAPSCPMCKAEQQRDKLLDGAAIPKRFQHMSLANWEAETDSQAKIKSICERYVSDVSKRCEDGTNLLLLGSVGTGKLTWLAPLATCFLTRTRRLSTFAPET